jgi:tol-pal system protein YbgF
LRIGVVKLIAVFAALVMTGCYGKQMVKGPIYTEQVYVAVDSLLGEQQKTQQMVQELRTQLDEEREIRARYEAQMGLTLRELEESIRVLTSQLEDQAQLQLRSGGAGTKPVYPLLVPVSAGATDSAAASADTTAVAANPSAAADELYRASYMDLTRGNYALAIQGFQNYLVRYPAGSHLPEVHYYLGECYYAGDRHLEAVGEFQYVVREFPESRLVVAAHLKSGLCYLQLEERTLAEKSFRELIEKYPDTEESKQARTELDKIQG